MVGTFNLEFPVLLSKISLFWVLPCLCFFFSKGRSKGMVTYAKDRVTHTFGHGLQEGWWVHWEIPFTFDLESGLA